MKKVLFLSFCLICLCFIGCSKKSDVEKKVENLESDVISDLSNSSQKNHSAEVIEPVVFELDSSLLEESSEEYDFFNYDFLHGQFSYDEYVTEDEKFIKRDSLFLELSSLSLNDLIKNYDFDFYVSYDDSNYQTDFNISKKNNSWNCKSFIDKKSSYYISNEIENDFIFITFGIADEHRRNCLNGKLSDKEYINGLEYNFPYFLEYDFPVVYKISISKENIANIIADCQSGFDTKCRSFTLGYENIIDTVCNGVVVSDRLNLCEGPDRGSESDVKLTKWDSVKIIGATGNSSNLEEGITGRAYPWYKIVLNDGSSGWAFGDFVRIIINDDDVARLKMSFEPFDHGVKKEGVTYGGVKVPIFNNGILYCGDEEDYPFFDKIDEFLNWYSDNELNNVKYFKISDYNPDFYTRIIPRSEEKNYIKSLKGIERLVNLKSLDLATCICHITSAPEVALMKNIQEIDFSKVPIASLNDIGSSESLKILKLNRTNISDLKGIERFPNIEELYIGYNNLTDISDIVKLKNIKLLSIEGSEENLNEESTLLLKKIREKRPDIEFYIDGY